MLLAQCPELARFLDVLLFLSSESSCGFFWLCHLNFHGSKDEPTLTDWNSKERRNYFEYLTENNIIY